MNSFLLLHQPTLCPLSWHPLSSSLPFLYTSFLPVPTSASFYPTIHSPSSRYVQRISVWPSPSGFISKTSNIPTHTHTQVLFFAVANLLSSPFRGSRCLTSSVSLSVTTAREKAAQSWALKQFNLHLELLCHTSSTSHQCLTALVQVNYVCYTIRQFCFSLFNWCWQTEATLWILCRWTFPHLKKENNKMHKISDNPKSCSTLHNDNKHNLLKKKHPTHLVCQMCARLVGFTGFWWLWHIHEADGNSLAVRHQCWSLSFVFVHFVGLLHPHLVSLLSPDPTYTNEWICIYWHMPDSSDWRVWLSDTP